MCTHTHTYMHALIHVHTHAQHTYIHKKMHACIYVFCLTLFNQIASLLMETAMNFTEKTNVSFPLHTAEHQSSDSARVAAHSWYLRLTQDPAHPSLGTPPTDASHTSPASVPCLPPTTPLPIPALIFVMRVGARPTDDVLQSRNLSGRPRFLLSPAVFLFLQLSFPLFVFSNHIVFVFRSMVSYRRPNSQTSSLLVSSACWNRLLGWRLD